ncbi:alkaline phosphatase family protein [Desulfonauticus submarinus]
MQKNHSIRTLIIGLDGMPLSLAQDLSEKGILNSLKPLLHSNKAVAIKSEIPYLSPVNWTSFFTATGPENHGVFGFTEYSFKKQKIFFSDSSQIKAQPIFHPNRANGKFFKIINLPHTYPAFPISGQLISGFLSLDLKKAIFPPPLYPILKAQKYTLEANTILALQNPANIFPELKKTLTSRELAFNLFWSDLAWDIFIFVLTEPDRLFHFCYDAVINQEHPLHQNCLIFLKKLDELLTKVLNKFKELPDPKRLILVADHGFTALKTEVDLNALLTQRGFLKFKKPPLNEWDLDCIHPLTKAFALDSGRIYLYPFDPTARKLGKQSLAQQIKEILLSMRYQGEKVISKVLEKKELYPNASFDHTPDLICVPRAGFDLKGKFDRKEIFAHFGRTGVHLESDVLFFDSFGEKPITLRDVGKLVEKNYENKL